MSSVPPLVMTTAPPVAGPIELLPELALATMSMPEEINVVPLYGLIAASLGRAAAALGQPAAAGNHIGHRVAVRAVESQRAIVNDVAGWNIAIDVVFFFCRSATCRRQY